jgi:hypothetical protein
MQLCGPEVALGIPTRSAGEAIKNWIVCQHCIAWKNYHVIDMANFLLVDHARKELVTCSN